MWLILSGKISHQFDPQVTAHIQRQSLYRQKLQELDYSGHIPTIGHLSVLYIRYMNHPELWYLQGMLFHLVQWVVLQHHLHWLH
jgi:hypothetical protein